MVDSSEDEGSSLRGNRFAVLGELPDRPRRRLVLVSEQVDHGVDHEWDSDTDTVAGGSEVEVGEILEPTVVQIPVAMEPRVRAPVRVFASLDAVDLSDVFERRAKVMRSVPHVLKGAFRMAMRVACQEILEGMEANSEVRVVRGWKLFLVLPRMMLFRPSRGGTVSRKTLESRVRQFQEGDWMSLVRESVSCADVAHNSAVSLGCTPSFGRSIVGTGNLATLGMLTDPTRRPPVARRALSPEVLDPVEFLTCLRQSRRGAAAGPSGMTSDHLFPVLENEGDSQRVVEVAFLLAVGRVPEEIIEVLRLGHLMALSKFDGGVGGIVVGDILRRMARTIAKQIAKQVEAATAPFQYALSTKAGCECVAHMLQSLTDLNPEVTVTSIDGVGAYDLISRSAMLEGL